MEKIKFLRSLVSDTEPTTLDAGELAINVADRTLFTGNGAGDVVELNEFKVRTKTISIPADTWLTLFRSEGIADINVVLLDNSSGRRSLLDFNFSNSYGMDIDLQVNNSFSHGDSDDNSIGNISGVRVVKAPTWYCYVQVKTSSAINLEIKISASRHMAIGNNYFPIFDTQDIANGTVYRTFTKSELVAIGSHIKPLMSEGELVYHRGDKPTKADVGLSNVPNYTFVDSVNDASVDKFASAGAVKKAYDLAAAALPKSGGEITGNVVIKMPDNDVARLNIQGTNQGAGVLYVGQSESHGGGIEYNGDNVPSTTDYVGSDNIILFRRSAGVDHWTARCFHDSNDWYFRGRLFVDDGANATEVYSSRNIPSKDVLGLGNVANYTISDSTTHDASTSYASSKAVHTLRAYVDSEISKLLGI